MLYIIAMKDTSNYICENNTLAMKEDQPHPNSDNIRRYETTDGKRWYKPSIKREELILRFGEINVQSSPARIVETISRERAEEILKKNREKYA